MFLRTADGTETGGGGVGGFAIICFLWNFMERKIEVVSRLPENIGGTGHVRVTVAGFGEPLVMEYCPEFMEGFALAAADYGIRKRIASIAHRHTEPQAIWESIRDEMRSMADGNFFRYRKG